jgi:hypothetical protein
MLTYRAYGRTIASDRPLPELEPTDGIADITVAWNSRTQLVEGSSWTALWRFSTEEPWVTSTRVNGVRYLRFGRFADVALSDGRIEVARRGHASGITVRHLVLDQALPLALASKGALVVHASAVTSGKRAIVLAGRAGAGKSTLAALLAREGMRVVADDGVVLEGRAPDVGVVASYPGLRLYRDSAAAAGVDVTRSAAVAEYSRKVRVIPSQRPDDEGSESLALGRMYVLAPGVVHLKVDATGDGRGVKFERLSRRDAAVEVLSHAYRIDARDRAGLEAQLDAVAAIAPDVWRVSYSLDLARAATVASAIAAHARDPESECR